MSFSVATVVTSVVLSSLASFGVVSLLHHKYLTTPTAVISTKKLEIVDSQGRVREVFELSKADQSKDSPRMAFLNANGIPSVQLEVDERGYASLGFSSDRWIEGAVLLGHFEEQDAVRDLKHDPVDMSGAWGLRVRGRGYDSTQVGFINSGEVLTPICGGSDQSLKKK